MGIKITTALAAALAARLKTELDGGFLYIFSGTVPATAGAATSGATKLATITESDDGVTGLTFETPTTGTLEKTAAETWNGTAAASGTATFYRFCEAGDAGTAADDTKVRVQGLVGTDPFTSELVLGTITITSGNAVPIASFSYNEPQA